MCRVAAISGCSSVTLVLNSDCSHGEDMFTPRGGRPALAQAGGGCALRRRGGGGQRPLPAPNPHPLLRQQQPPPPPLRRGGHRVSSRSCRTDRYFTKQRHSLGSCPEPLPKGICSGCFLPKGIMFHLIAPCTRQKAYAMGTSCLKASSSIS